MDNSNIEFGSHLKAARDRKGISQIDVMAKTGINNKTLSGYENGVSEPNIGVLKSLAECYGVTIDDIVNGKVSIKESFGEYLRRLRKSKKMTILQVCAKTGISNGYISNFECGNRGIPSPDILRKLSLALDCTYINMMIAAGYLLESEVAEWKQ